MPVGYVAAMCPARSTLYVAPFEPSSVHPNPPPATTHPPFPPPQLFWMPFTTLSAFVCPSIRAMPRSSAIHNEPSL